MSLNLQAILHALGLLVLLEVCFLVIPLIASLILGDGQFFVFLISFLITAFVGFSMWYPYRGTHDFKRRDIYVIVSLGWVVVSLFGMLPYLISGAIPQLSMALFETVSGFTTTGATILTNIESLPQSILLWRSLTQWIGGMGFVVLMIAVMPLLGIGGMQLFIAESPGLVVDRIRPRIRDTAVMMWIVYASLTASAFMLLAAGGMSVFEAINHAFTTLAIGGFSTQQESIAAFSPYIQYVIILFMLLAGINFALLYSGFAGRIKNFFKNEELRYYLGVAFVSTIIAFLYLSTAVGKGTEEAFREGMFQVVSIMTTTGFTTTDYTLWIPPLMYLIFILMFVGGMTGSTAGGVKVMRHIVLFKSAFREFKKQLHPDALLPIHFNNLLVKQSIQYRIVAFIIFYILIILGSIPLLIVSGVDTTTSVGAVVATIGNIGPGLGEVGPGGTYAGLPTHIHYYLSLLMIVGRLELFTVLILFTPYFWRRY